MRFFLIPLVCVYFLLVRYFAALDNFWLYTDIVLFSALTVPILSFLHNRKSEQRKALQLTLCWQVLIVLAMCAHALSIALQTNLLMLWLFTALIGGCSAIGMEWCLLVNRLQRNYQQVKKAGILSGLIGLLLAILANINYLAIRHNVAYDFSYLRVTKVSATTEQLLANISEALHIYLFFTADDEPYTYVHSYLTKLGAHNIPITVVDKGLRPDLAQKYRVHENGNVIFAYAPTDSAESDKSERVYISADMRIARSKIRNLDALVQQALLRLQAKPRHVYFWQGHGEFTWDYHEHPPRSLRHWRALLLKQNFRVRYLSPVSGSVQKIPDDATLVVIAAPVDEFMLEEVQALRDYLANGGKAIILLNTGATGEEKVAKQPLLEFLRSEIGITFHNKILANDRTYVAARKSSIDRWYVLTNNFAQHKAAATLADNNTKAHVIFFQSGYFTLHPANKHWQTQMLIESLATTFIDHNRNFAYDAPAEQRGKYAQCLVAKEIQQQGKVFACADATLAADPLMQNIGNRLLLVDSVRWLLATDDLGISSSEVDVKITHSKDKDIILFYSTTVVVPCVLLVIGFLVRRRAFSSFFVCGR